MKFNELDDEFEFDKEKKRDIKTKIRILVLFVIFSVIIISIVRNNFSFAYGIDDKLETICGPKNTWNNRDDSELLLEKVRRAVEVNSKKIETINGFLKIYISNEAIGYKNRKIPVINIIFSKEDKMQKIIPEQICNFDVKILYK